MKRILMIAAVATSILALSLDAHASKMDLVLKAFVAKPAVGKALIGKAVTMRGDKEMVSILIKSSDLTKTRATIEGAGGSVGHVIGHIMTANVPTSLLATLDAAGEVEGLEASKPMHLLMDTARANSGVDRLQAGYEGIHYTGKNVVVGVLDTGIDYDHPDFQNSDGESRVQYLNFQSATPTKVNITQCAHDKIVDGECTIPVSNDSEIGHGSHVSGIAAGSDSTYTGVAKAADIMFVRNDFVDDINEGTASFSAGILDGVAEIFEKSDIIDKPAVVNISQGTHIGAHDNTSLMEQGINDAVNGEYSEDGHDYGRIVVAAAGNEHIVYDLITPVADSAGGIHATMSVSNGSSRAWRMWVLSADAPARTPIIADLWFGTGQASKCEVQGLIYKYVTAFGGAVTTTDASAATESMEVSAEDTKDATDDDNITEVIVATDATDSQNEKPRALFGFAPGSDGTWADIETDAATKGYILDVVVRATGGNCTGNIWIEGGGTYIHFMKNIDASAEVGDGTNGDGYDFGDGDNDMTVGLPATASGIISVGAYLQEKPYDGEGKSEWTGDDGITYDATDPNEPIEAQVNGGTVGQRCPFSSLGPTADGRTKPDVIAPGDPIISTLPTGFSPDEAIKVGEDHYKNQGTSQASPHVAGLIALMMEKNNTLTAADAKTALMNTATAVAMTIGKASANNEVGAGKIDATAAVHSISEDTSGYSGTDNLTTKDLEDGGSTSSKGGCGGEIAPGKIGASPIILLMLMLPISIILFRRRRAS
jgi:subtilisin family serine protease